MITDIDFDDSPITAGETRSLAVHGAAPIRIRISCFVFKPPPPDYRPCDACGVLDTVSGQAVKITADLNTFQEYGGELHLHIVDHEGDQREVRTKVWPRLFKLQDRVTAFERAES